VIVLIAVSMATLSIVTDSVYPPPVSPVDIDVEKIYFQNGLLRANITWRFDEGVYVYIPIIKIFNLPNVVSTYFLLRQVGSSLQVF